MSTTTEKQLERATKRASGTRGATTTKARAKTSGASTRGAAAAKAGKSPSRIVSKRTAASKTPGNGMPQAMAKESSEEWSQDMAADGIGTTAHKDANVHGHGAGDDATKIKVSRSCNGCENAGKPLTETGKKRLVNRLLGLAETQATQGSFKITPADLIRLMQLHKEMNPQKDRKVIVQWIEDRPE